MPKLGLSLGVQSGAFLKQSPSFDASYQAVLDKATAMGYPKPSAPQQVKQNQLIVDLKAAGIWALLDCFQVYANDGSSSFGLINWKNPTGNIGSISGTLTFNKYGFLGSGAGFINSGYNPTTNAVNLSIYNASYGVWKYANDNTSGRSIVGNSAGTNQIVGNLSVSYNSRIFTTSDLGASAPNQATGLIFISRQGASGATNNTVWSVNGSNTNFSPFGTVSIPNANFAVLTSSIASGNASSYFGGISMFFTGANLSGKSTEFTTAMTTYINSL